MELLLAALAGWPLAGGAGLALLRERRRAGRKRLALERSLHELRRPLQLLAISQGARGHGQSRSALRLAISALGQLERELSGHRGEPLRPTAVEDVARATVARWQPLARRQGGSILLRWRAGGACVIAEPSRLAQALDNLVANAIEHGGPRVIVEARTAGQRLRVSVLDEGRSAGDGALPTVPGGAARRGHGLEVVRSIARAHRGRFVIQRSEQGAVAMLELPIAGPGAALAA